MRVCVCAQSSSLSSSLKKIFITTIINIIIIQIPTLFFRALSNQHHSGSQRQAALQNNTISLVITVTSRRLLPWYYTLHFLLNEKWMGKLNEPGRQKLEELKSRQQTKRTKLYAILRAKRQHMTRPRKVARADELSLSPNGRGGGSEVRGGGRGTIYFTVRHNYNNYCHFLVLAGDRVCVVLMMGIPLLH